MTVEHAPAPAEVGQSAGASALALEQRDETRAEFGPAFAEVGAAMAKVGAVSAEIGAALANVGDKRM